MVFKSNFYRFFLTLLSLSPSAQIFSGLDSHKRKCLVHCDLNKTVIASDIASGKSVKDVLNQLIAEQRSSCWCDTIKKPITYDNYVKKHLYPGDKSDQKLKKLRNEKLFNFVAYLGETNHPMAFEVEKQFAEVYSAISQQQGSIFNSFYTLLEKLEKSQTDYAMILRTFGKDLDCVILEIEKKLGRSFFDWRGQFKEGKLELKSLKTGEIKQLHDTQDIYEFLKTAGNCAIRDDWSVWNAHGEISEYGKLFPLALEDSDVDSYFFDDNADDGILNPRDPETGKFIPVDALIDSGNVVVVNTLEAILDGNYFIDKII